MRRARSIAVLTAALATLSAVAPSAAAEDPLAAAIATSQATLRELPAGDPIADGIRTQVEPVLDEAAQELREGRRWLALSRLALVWRNVHAIDYRASIPVPEDGRVPLETLEREWKRLEPELAGRPGFDGVPAAARAIGEAALGEVPVYFAASLEYGRNTTPANGLFYLGTARAQLELARLAARWTTPPLQGEPLAPRSVAREIDALDAELLAAYRPPLSIDGHGSFIGISAMLKQARELDAAGLRHGALFKLLDARLRLSRLLRSGSGPGAEEILRRAAEIETELDASPRDPSLVELFLETARSAAADPDPDSGGAVTAAAIVEDVLPLYRATLGPAPPAAPATAPRTTVTVVRWPYT